MQANPLHWLELRTRVREHRLWVLVVAIITMLVTITGIALAASLQSQWRHASPSDVGTAVCWATLYLQTGLLLLLAPLGTAGKIAQEREQRTITALLNSPAKRFTIVFGKLLGAWTFLGWLACLSLPFIFTAVLWGGPNPATLVLFTVVNLLAAATLAAIGLGFSGYFGRSLTAYLVTGAVLFAWLVVLPVFGMLLIGGPYQGDNVYQLAISYLCFFHHPLYPLILLSSSPFIPTEDAGYRLAFCFLVWFILGSASFLLAVRGLKREIN